MRVNRPKPPVRLTRRGRAALVVVVAALSLGGLWLGTRAVSLAAAAQPVPSHAGLPWVVVEDGDTLWTIAEAVSPEGDPIAVAQDIMRQNGLKSSLIRPGTRLYIPSGH
ncbi:LysM peptidoglycan-binding domain-containing protein [Nonomuraea sp. NPDC050790]|uniref:LysM peptidoglycan-binding domain-containing protein n=1 Tax=Nonomuraea sp. NPDC050790 TaxID=3364371 RepID=UPI00378C310D